MATVTELVTKFSFQGSTAPLGKFNEGLGGSINLLGKMAAGMVAVAGVINTLVVTTLAGADSMGQLSKNTGVAIADLQELGFIASVSGSSAAALEGTIANLSQTIGQAAQKGNEDFARLGISVRDANGQVKQADVILTEVSQRFKQLGLSLQEQQSFAQALGIDASLIQMLNRTSSEMLALRKRAREFGTVTEEQQKNIIEFNDSFTTLRFGMDAIRKQVAIGLSPAIKEMAEQFTDFLAANRGLIIDGFVKFGEGITAILQGLDRLKFVIAAIIGLFIVLKISTIGLAAVLGTVFSPVVLITAGIIALLLVVDDLMVAFSGGKSIIRDFFMEFFGFDIKSVMDNWVAGISGFAENVKRIFSGIGEYVATIFQPFFDLFDKVKGFLGIGGDGAMMPPANQTIRPGASGAALTTNSTIQQSVTIEIKTDDPATAGQAVSDALQNQLDNANTQLRRGGR